MKLKFNNGKDLTIISLLWLGMALYAVLVLGDTTLGLLCVVMSEQTMIDTGMHLIGKQVIGIVKRTDEDGDSK